MAELLIRASPHWKDSLSQVEVDKMSEFEKDSYNSRTQIGDIICVRPDGWKWGKEECLPTFIVVKLPFIKDADLKHLEESLQDGSTPSKMLKRRKFRIPPAWVTAQTESSITITLSAQQQQLLNNIIEKTS